MSTNRLGYILAISALVLIVLIISMFVYFFHSYDFSKNVSDWGAFGSYFGGVLGASVSTLALIGAVIALRQQHIADKRYNDHAIASDLLRSVERIEDAIDRSLKELNISLVYPKYNISKVHTAYDILMGMYPPNVIEKIVPRYSDNNEDLLNEIMSKDLSEQDRLDKMKLIEIVSETVGRLKLMKQFISEHKKLSGHNATSLYYMRKYKSLASTLNDAGYQIGDWGNLSSM